MEEGFFDGGAVGAGAQGLGGVLGEDAALAHEEEAVAALRLVHDVRGDEEGGAVFGGEAVEEVPQVAAEYGVEADGRFVQDEEVGGAEQGDGEETRLRWPPESCPARASACEVRSTSARARVTAPVRRAVARRPGSRTAAK